MQDEFVEVFSEQLSCRSEVVSVKCDLFEKAKDATRIVCATVDGYVRAFTYDGLNRLLPICSVQIAGLVPRSAVFTGAGSQSISVLGVAANKDRRGLL